jgi:arylsulfatase
MKFGSFPCSSVYRYPHQESIRVPLIIKDPRMSPQFIGTTNDEFTLNIDLAATILSAAGLQPLPSMMGRDMSVLYRKNMGMHGATTAQVRRRAAFSTEGRQFVTPASDGGGRYHSGSESEWRTEFFYEHPMHSNPSYIPASEALVRKDYKYFYW